ncbi:hypothetical protein F2Q69_00027323 [Brassica cretica]|uniref:Uncharacterized protein n=1 Tax=Brassica cretica TaxID=69181 RepID=A0A8S9SBP0_BRACR|nr:hypothetical protein F2Q69_00027323 [Brassica cretica]
MQAILFVKTANSETKGNKSERVKAECQPRRLFLSPEKGDCATVVTLDLLQTVGRPHADPARIPHPPVFFMLLPMSPKKKRRNALLGSSKMARLQTASKPPASVHLLKKKSQIAGAECSVAEIVTEVAIESVLPCISEVICCPDLKQEFLISDSHWSNKRDLSSLRMTSLENDLLKNIYPDSRMEKFCTRYMPSSTRSNKETKLLFSSDPASLERSIRKEIRSSSIDNNTSSSIDSRQPPSTPRPISSTDTRFPPSTEDTFPSTDTFHPISIDISVRTSINIEPRDMVATLILVRDDRETCMTRRVIYVMQHVRGLTLRGLSHPKSIDRLSRASIENTYGVDRILQSREDHDSQGVRSKTPTSACPFYVKIDRQPPAPIDRQPPAPIDRQKKAAINRQPPAPIDRRSPLKFRVQMPKIDVARLNALRPQPKPSDNPPEAIRTPSDDTTDPMEIDRVPMGRTLRKRNEKVVKHLKRGDKEKERENKTRETEEDIRRMFCEAREKMKKRITLKKKNDHGKFAVPCTVKGIEFPHALSSNQRPRRSSLNPLRLGRSSPSIAYGLLRFWDSLNFKKDTEFLDSWVYSARRANYYIPSLKTGSIVKVDRFEVARCSSMYMITDHSFLICFISPTIIDEVITGAPEINLQS